MYRNALFFIGFFAMVLILSLPLTAMAQTCEIQVNTTIYSSQTDPAVAVHSDGSFVVVWDSYYQDGSYNGVFGQRFDNAGEKAGDVIHITLTDKA